MTDELFALKVQGLTVHYADLPVLWDIELTVPQGKMVGILGPNGAGKSTFLKAVLGLVPVVSGSMWILGQKGVEARSRVAYVPQREVIDWDFPITVKELVLMGAYPRLGLFSKVTKNDKKMALECLDAVGMLAFHDRQISQLSGGQQQRAFLARALLQKAEIYFLDEPIAGVDHASEEIIMSLLAALKKEKKTIFMIHHDLNNVEKYFDHLILLNIRLIASGKTAHVFTKELLKQAYGKNLTIFDEAMRLSHTRTSGLA